MSCGSQRNKKNCCQLRPTPTHAPQLLKPASIISFQKPSSFQCQPPVPASMRGPHAHLSILGRLYLSPSLSTTRKHVCLSTVRSYKAWGGVGESGTTGVGGTEMEKERKHNIPWHSNVQSWFSVSRGIGQGLVTPTQAAAFRGLSPCVAITGHSSGSGPQARSGLCSLRAWGTGKTPGNLFQGGTKLKPS